MLDLGGQECLSKHVSNHFASQAENELNFAFVDDPADEMEVDVNVFCACMILVVLVTTTLDKDRRRLERGSEVRGSRTTQQR